ncbi:conserved hypothetical protein [Ricinus communis]|uniref:Uncharacterized protein n=1 Tax=Ricinus communis TaxID=3988 RepID=B9REK3_RICCO|nr:conserved hypothetical protein [Ricinus communis]
MAPTDPNFLPVYSPTGTIHVSGLLGSPVVSRPIVPDYEGILGARSGLAC